MRLQAALVLALTSLLLSTACVERKMRIRSDPSGATVYVDGRRVGDTPHDESFVWYGTREVILVKEGHQTSVSLLPLRIPIYQIPPVDVVTDVLVPWTIEDDHPLDVSLAPVQKEDPDLLLERAERYREGE